MIGGGVTDRAAVVGQDEPLLALVFRDHHRSLVRTAYLLLGDAGDAEEAVQEAYFRVERAVQRSSSVDVALPYVRTAVLNVCRSGLRRRVVALRRPHDRPLDVASAEEGVLAGAEGAAVAAALRRLPARQRECLVLRYYAELSEAEIASTLGISAGSVKTHAHRGLAALSHLLEDR
jgi:RNA polymerase sigma-70 factor (sigma-E family)